MRDLVRPTRILPLVLALFAHSAASAQERSTVPSVGEEEDGASALALALAPAPPPVGLFPAEPGPRSLVPDRNEGFEARRAVQIARRRSVPLMAAGGTLLVAGAVIGGDAGTLLMVGGAGILAWGVYLHF